MAKWVAFYNKETGKKLVAISIEGLFAGEIESTKELLAYENGVSVSDIEARRE